MSSSHFSTELFGNNIIQSVTNDSSSDEYLYFPFTKSRKESRGLANISENILDNDHSIKKFFGSMPVFQTTTNLLPYGRDGFPKYNFYGYVASAGTVMLGVKQSDGFIKLDRYTDNSISNTAYSYFFTQYPLSLTGHTGGNYCWSYILYHDGSFSQDINSVDIEITVGSGTGTITTVTAFTAKYISRNTALCYKVVNIPSTVTSVADQFKIINNNYGSVSCNTYYLRNLQITKSNFPPCFEKSTFTVDEVYETSHPYTNNYSNTWTITKSNATAIRVYFETITTEVGFDKITTSAGDKLEGSKSGIWSKWGEGSTFTITFTSDGSVTYYGFKVTKVQYVTYNSASNDRSWRAGFLNNLNLNKNGFISFWMFLHPSLYYFDASNYKIIFRLEDWDYTSWNNGLSGNNITLYKPSTQSGKLQVIVAGSYSTLIDLTSFGNQCEWANIIIQYKSDGIAGNSLPSNNTFEMYINGKLAIAYSPSFSSITELRKMEFQNTANTYIEQLIATETPLYTYESILRFYDSQENFFK